MPQRATAHKVNSAEVEILWFYEWKHVTDLLNSLFGVDIDISNLQREIGPANIRRRHKDAQMVLLTVMFSDSSAMILNLRANVEFHVES